ncbi:hypothetical protein NQ315_016245 [Exocentrus adspersus]|uniref:Uncharacterized protein n=1 Tax=Exocentrus adspersus TaxID=1586481 RepID=A0AAV8VJU5_9CUCU|nr:hypothetical protein NQ315_016245 [Exocentrus adspersus]
MEDILDIDLLGSDSDDDLDDLLLYHVLNDNLGHRADLYGRFSLNAISEIEAKQSFRFEKRHIPRLAEALNIPDEITTRENITLTGVQALCILLRRLTYPNRLADLESFFWLFLCCLI